MAHRIGGFAVALLLLFEHEAGATAYAVGPTQTHKSVCLLLADGAITLGPGDVVTVDPGTYTDACQVHPSGSAAAPIILQGAPGPMPVFDANGLDLSGSGSVPRATLQFNGAAFWTVQHLEFKNAANAALNGSAFRVTAGGHDITYRDVSIHDNQDGAQSDGPATIVIENSEIFHNGAGDGYSHNLYLLGDYVRLQGNYIHDSVGGQNVKLRVHTIELLYNLIANEGNYAIDFEQSPNTNAANANAVMIGNVIVRNPASLNDSQTIVFGSDGTPDVRNGNLYAINNTFVLTNASNGLLHMLSPAPGSHAYFYNNIFHATVSGTHLSTDAASDALMSGSNNWVTTGMTSAAAFTGTIGGADPGFVSTTDFHLLMTGAAIDKGLASPMYADGTGAMKNGTPQFEFIEPLGTKSRALVGALDLGAYEFGTPPMVPDGDGGAGGTDGGAPTDPGIGADGGSPGNSADPSTTDSAGCGCKMAAPSTSRSAPSFIAFALAALGFRRRSKRD